jgi:predicted nucleotidyltransferase
MTEIAKTPAMPAVAMEAHEWEILRAILGSHLRGRTVWAYGSRARRGVRRYSDLDLAVSAAKIAASWELEHALDESLLPFKVDVVYLEDLGDEFRRRIERDFVMLQA